MFENIPNFILHIVIYNVIIFCLLWQNLLCFQVKTIIHDILVTCWLEIATCVCCASIHSTLCPFFHGILLLNTRSRSLCSSVINVIVTSKQNGAYQLTIADTTRAVYPSQNQWHMKEVTFKFCMLFLCF